MIVGRIESLEVRQYAVRLPDRILPDAGNSFDFIAMPKGQCPGGPSSLQVETGSTSSITSMLSIAA